MSDGQDVALQKVVYALLSQDDGVITLLGTPPQIFDKVPADVAQAFMQGAGKTYLTIGAGSTKPNLYDDFDLTEHILHFDVWSQKIGMVEAKTIVRAVSDALTGAFAAGTLVLDGQTISLCDPHGSLFERGPDMVTTHGALQMRLLISPAG